MTNGSPSLPMYFLIRSMVKKRLLDGTYPLGSKIPSEMELSKEFNVHRLTVRHALLLLVQEGYLKRFRKRGTFVAKQAKEFLGVEFKGFFANLLNEADKFKPKKVEISSQIPPEMVADLFHLNPKQDKVTVIKRLRFLGKTPGSLTISYLPKDIGKAIQKKDLYKMSLIKIFKEKLNIPLGEAFQIIEPSLADKYIAEALKIPLGAPILLIQRTFFKTDGTPFDFVQSFYRGDKFRFFVRFKYDEEEDHLLLTKWVLGKTA